MAEAFRSELLRIENRVHPSTDQPCIICLTGCDTLCSETGTVEWEVRLPCKHTVGSRCIAKWLDPLGVANNSCPVCRYVFFPAQPRPYLEHGTFDGDDWIPATAEDESAEMMYEDNIEEDESVGDMRLRREIATLYSMCDTYCQRLDLAPIIRVTDVSEHLARRIFVLRLFDYRDVSSLAAVSVLVASHLLYVPRTVRQVSMMSGVAVSEIRRLYRLFRLIPDLADFIDEDMLTVIDDSGDLEAVLSYLCIDRGP